MSSLELTADCARCCALCCVVYPFVSSPQFAANKPAHVACAHVTSSFRCAIHAERPARGYPGCVSYDCHGAGQYVTQTVFAGRPWTELEDSTPMFDLFLRLRPLFAHLSLLRTAHALDLPAPVRASLRTRDAQLRALIGRPLAELREIDSAAECAVTDRLLRALAAHVDRDALIGSGLTLVG